MRDGNSPSLSAGMLTAANLTECFSLEGVQV